MFLSHEYRARAIGVAAAYAVLITVLVISGVFDPPPSTDEPQITRANVSPPEKLRACTDTVC